MFSQVLRKQLGLHLPCPLHSAISIPLYCPLQQFLATLQLWKERIKAFLKQWVNTEIDSFVRTRRIQLLQEALEQLEVQTALETASTDKNDLSTETHVMEFNVLIGKDFLNKYNHTASIENNYALAFEVIESNAPTWISLLARLMIPSAVVATTIRTLDSFSRNMSYSLS
jgi:hypothetical protein